MTDISRHPARSLICDRLFEITMTIALIGMALACLQSGDVLTKTAFRKLLSIHMTQTILGTIFGTLGFLRVVALVVNGRSRKWGPRIRFGASVACAFLWAEIALAIYLASPILEAISLGVPMYLALSVGEVGAGYRAATDVTG